MSVPYEDGATYAPLRLFEYDHDRGRYCLMCGDGAMAAYAAVFEAQGRLPNGYGFTDMTLQLMRTCAPELEARVGFDPEAGMFVAYGRDLPALQQLGKLLVEALADREALAKLVRDAPWEYD